jgi:hypothetical protein
VSEEEFIGLHDRRRNATKGELDDCKNSVDEQISAIKETVAVVASDAKKIREIVEAWDNAKGFVNTVKGISATIKFLALFAAALAGLWYIMTTGHIPPK